MATTYAPPTHDRSVTGRLNFAADPTDGGEFSNFTPERSRQKLTGRDVEIRNGREWPVAPSLAREGLTIVEHPAGAADWANPEWIETVYVPSCIALVKRLTGAETAAHVYVPVQRRVNYKDFERSAPSAGFVHLDQTRDGAARQAGEWLAPHGVTFRRAVIYNVWKSMTPPPQDYPLAVSDIRTVPAEDHVPGNTVEYFGGESGRFESPYLMLAPSGRPVFYYYPDMSVDESLVFVGVDLDPARPLGCAHTAFRHPAPGGPTSPRASIEVRVLVVLE